MYIVGKIMSSRRVVVIVFIKSSVKGLFCFCYGSMWVSTSHVLPGAGGGDVYKGYAKDV